MNKIINILELNYQADSKEKIRVSPIGSVTGIDNRIFDINSTELLESINKNSLHIPLDANHSFGNAVGWFDKASFEERADGIYATLELNNDGKKLLLDKSYRYLSPVFNMDANTRKVTGLHSVGLVNHPNLLNEELNKTVVVNMNNEEKKMDERLKELEDNIKALQDENKALIEANSNYQKKIHADLVENAIRNGELLPSHKEFAMKLREQELNDYLTLHKLELNRLKAETDVKKEVSESLTAEQIAVNKQLGI